jgi:predicted metal-dependent phosphotriesterase family hydrolase
MPHVQTVLGPVAPGDLGRVMPHEHLLSLVPGPWLAGGEGSNDIELAVSALSGLAGLGFGTVVDLSPYGVVGRDPDGDNAEALRAISRRSGLHIVSGSSVYMEAYSPRWSLDADVAELTQRLVRDATVGIGSTTVRAGIFGEQATSLGEITPHEEKCLRATARAHRETGLAIATHTTHGTMGVEQLDILVDEGADLERVVVGHMDTHADPHYAERILDRGVNIAIDTIGKQVWDFFLGPPPSSRHEGEFSKRSYFRSDHGRADMVASLVAAGHSPRILLAQDLTGAEVWMNPDTHGQRGYRYLGEVFIPLLLERGVTEEQCDEMTRSNPGRMLTLP